MAYRLGVDVGGTFTDLFLVNDESGTSQFRVKTPSTPSDPSQGVLTGVQRICEEAGIGAGEDGHPSLDRSAQDLGLLVQGEVAPVACTPAGIVALLDRGRLSAQSPPQA